MLRHSLNESTPSVLPRQEKLTSTLSQNTSVKINLTVDLSLLIFCLFSPLFISCSLSLTHSCLMRRSRTAKRMNHAEWVPAVLFCLCVSALWSGVLAVIRAEANSGGSRLTHGAGKEQMAAAYVTDRILISAISQFLSSQFIFKGVALDQIWVFSQFLCKLYEKQFKKNLFYLSSLYILALKLHLKCSSND